MSVTSYISTYDSNSDIYVRSMQSLEQFGFYVTWWNDASSTQTVVQYQLDMEIDSSSTTGALLLDSNGYDYVEVEGNRI